MESGFIKPRCIDTGLPVSRYRSNPPLLSSVFSVRVHRSSRSPVSSPQRDRTWEVGVKDESVFVDLKVFVPSVTQVSGGQIPPVFGPLTSPPVSGFIGPLSSGPSLLSHRGSPRRKGEW